MTIDQDPRKREPMHPKPAKPTGMALIQLAGDDMALRARAFDELTEYQRSGVLRDAAAQIGAAGWGKKLSVEMRRDVARYALSVGTDPVRHWEVLGGSLYDKAELWLDLVTSHDEYSGYEHEYVHDDDRLDDEERHRRQQLRAKHGVPEDVKGACVVKLYRSDRSHPSIGVNWAGNRKCYLAAQKKEGTKEDPIGEQDPAKTAFTRAFRKAAKTAFPLYFRRTKKKERDEGVPLNALDRTEAAMQDERALQKRIDASVTPFRGVKPSADPYPKAEEPEQDEYVPLDDGPPIDELHEDLPESYETESPAPTEKITRESCITWGKKAGTAIKDLPQAYLEWATVDGRTFGDDTEAWQEAMREELEYRRQQDDGGAQEPDDAPGDLPF